jgi:RNA polymerase-interacting CarD/CdnL/TRCF family regulator
MFYKQLQTITTMPYTIKLSELARMNPVEKDKALSALVNSAQFGNGDVTAVLNARIHEYELKYEMTSDELNHKLADNDLQETAEIAKWLFWIKTRKHLAQQETQSE